MCTIVPLPPRVRLNYSSHRSDILLIDLIIIPTYFLLTFYFPISVSNSCSSYELLFARFSMSVWRVCICLYFSYNMFCILFNFSFSTTLVISISFWKRCLFRSSILFSFFKLLNLFWRSVRSLKLSLDLSAITFSKNSENYL